MTGGTRAEMEEGGRGTRRVRSQARSGDSEAEAGTGEERMWPGPRGSCFSMVFFTNRSPPPLRRNFKPSFLLSPCFTSACMCYYSFILE